MPTSSRAATRTCAGAGEITVDESRVGFRASDVSDLGIAANGVEALVAFAVSGDRGCDHDGCYVLHEMFTARVDASGIAQAPVPVRSSAAGISPRTDAVPVVVHHELALLTQGHGGAASHATPGAEPPDTMYLLQNDAITWRSKKWFSGAYAAATAGDGALVLGTGIESPEYRTGTAGPPSVRAFRIVREKGPEGVLVMKSAAAAPRASELFDAPAVTASGSRGAIAFRHAENRASVPKTVLAGWVDPSSGKGEAIPVVIDRGDVGAPALLLDGDTLHIVYASRPNAKAPYLLQHVTWPRGAAPGAPTSLATPTTSARAPALARAGGRFAVAWSAGESDRVGAVHAGVGDSLDAAAGAATLVSGAATNARDPEWAEAGEGAYLVWTEHGESQRIRIAVCR